MERVLEGGDAVVYLLDYTKLGTNDEAELFRSLRHINPGGDLARPLGMHINSMDGVGLRAPSARYDRTLLQLLHGRKVMHNL